MTISERLFAIMEEKGKKAADLCRLLDIKTSVTSSWKQRNSDPPAKYITQICKFLEVSPSYLLTGANNSSTDADLNPKELHLIEQYRKLNDRYQSKLVDTADDYVLLPGALRELNAESSGCKIS